MSAPRVDTGEPGSARQTIREALSPSLERARNSLLTASSMVIVLAIFETFRLPNPDIAVFFVLLMMREDAQSTVGGSLGIGIGIGLAPLLTSAVLAAGLSQPAVRLALMALLTFATMFGMRASTLGMPLFLLGFIGVYASTGADTIAEAALATGQVRNAEGVGLPQIAFMPPEEALLHSVLWFSAAAIVPAAVTLTLNRLFGRDPARLLRRALGERMDSCAGFCRGEPGAVDALRAAARAGTAPLLKLADLAERAHRRSGRHAADIDLVRALQRIVLVLLAWHAADAGSGAGEPVLRRLGAVCDDIARRVRAGAADRALVADGPEHASPEHASATREQPERDPAVRFLDDDLIERAALPDATGHTGPFGLALPALAVELRRTLDAAHAADQRRLAAEQRAARTPFRFFRPGAINAADTRFALKVTLAVMIAYTIENGLDWPGIHTCVATAFMTALGTVGESVHKMTLRIVGATVGGTLGIGCIIGLMPSMTGFAQIAAVVAAVGFVAAWIGYGSPRISYAGWQIMLAFSLTTLDGFGPTLDMEAARDRVVGVLLGNVVTALCLIAIWPVRVAPAVRAGLAGALDALGAIAALGARPVGVAAAASATEIELRDSFAGSVAQVGALMPNDRFEPGRAHGGAIGRDALARLARVLVPLSVIATDELDAVRRDELPRDTRDTVQAHQQQLSDWFGGLARWIRTGDGADRLRADLPAPPSLRRPASGATARRVAAREALYGLLARELHALLDAMLPARTEGTATVATP